MNDQNIEINTGFRGFPFVYSTAFSFPAKSYVADTMFPLGLSFQIGAFVMYMINEKEERIHIMMQMNGLKKMTYYFVNYVHIFIMQLIGAVFLLIGGFIFQYSFFTETAAGVYLILFLLWSFCTVSLVFFIKTFFAQARQGMIVTNILMMLSIAIQLVVVNLFTTSGPPAAYYIWPPFAFYSAIHYINIASYDDTMMPYSMSTLSNASDPVAMAYIALVIGAVAYLLVAFYLEAVLPSQYGTRKPFYFPITDGFHMIKRLAAPKVDVDIEKAGSETDINRPIDEEEVQFEDADVKAERKRVMAGIDLEGAPLVIKRLRKEYPGGKVAVKDITLALERNFIFGLLGPNGAGKTSLISVLTGSLPVTLGSAMVNGFDLRTEVESVYNYIGICPQHDILWSDLNVEDHLLFYARLKGVETADEKRAVDEAIDRVSLQSFRKRLPPGLSGGEKRRLSIAIALIADPAVVFLDEPTTGLDLEVRRLIWNIIQNAKNDKLIILVSWTILEC